MRKQTRRCVFESNSSSTHSLTVNKLGCTGTLEVDEYENKVITQFGEFGWGYDVYNDPETKLSYLVTMLIETHRDCCTLDELYETEDFAMINEAVANYCNCDGIIIDEDLVRCNDEEDTWCDHNGYIDHQSIMDIGDLLADYDCSVEEFIFDRGIVLVIDCDN